MCKYFQQIDIETSNNVKIFQMSSTKILSLFIAGGIAVAIILMLVGIIGVGPCSLIILIDIIAELAVMFLMSNDKTSRTKVGKSDFFIDFRKFMNFAPCPYSPGYADRSDINLTFPDKKASNKCLQIDMDIYNYIFEHYNLDEQYAVQAIVDEDADPKHLFDTDKRNVGDKYVFNAVFSETTVGRLFSQSGYLSNFVCLNLSVGSTARGILQHTDVSVGHY